MNSLYGVKQVVGLPKGQKLLILRCLAGSARALTPAEILGRDREISEAGIYVALARMTTNGWLNSKKDETTHGERGSPRRRYKITGVGREVLQMAEQFEVLAAKAEGALS